VVHGESFFGRTHEIADLTTRLRHDQSVLILGERRIGKTSLLTHSREHLDLFAPETPIIDIATFACRSASQLADAIIRSLKLQHPVRASARRDSIDLCVDLLASLKRRGKRVVIFLNDLDDALYHYQENVEEGHVLRNFCRSIIDAGHCLACATSFRELDQLDAASHQAPLFNVFHCLTLRGFAPEEALFFFSQASAQSGDQLQENECVFFADLLGVIPFHLQVAGFNLFSQEGFVGSTGSQRLSFLTNAVDLSIRELHEHWCHKLDHISIDQRRSLFATARTGKVELSADTTYLTTRGILDIGDNPFQSMGGAFREFMAGFSEEHAGKAGFWTNLMQGVINTATKTAIETAVKGYLT